MIAAVITLLLKNFTLTFFLAGMVSAGIAILRSPAPRSQCLVREKLLSHFVLFAVGFLYLYNCVLHTVFARMTAHFIGWADSPFQLEVGFASLGFALAGFLGFRGSYDVKFVAIAASAMFMLGAGGGHIYQIVRYHNVAPGNAGTVFYADFWLPAAGFLLLYLSKRCHAGIAD